MKKSSERVMGYLQALLVSYCHLRCEVASVVAPASTPATAAYTAAPHRGPALPSRVLRPVLPVIAACSPSSFSRAYSPAACVVAAVQTRASCRAQVATTDWPWQHKRRRRRGAAEGATAREAGDRVVGKNSRGTESFDACYNSAEARGINHGQRQTKLTERDSTVSPVRRRFTGGVPQSFLDCRGKAWRCQDSPLRTMRRHYHTQSPTELLNLRTADSLSAEKQKSTDNTASPTSTLLDSILRRLDQTSAAHVRSAAQDGAHRASTLPGRKAAYSSVSAAPSTTAKESDEEQNTTASAYVPLLFRADFIESAALRRRQSAPPRKTSPVTSHTKDAHAFSDRELRAGAVTPATAADVPEVKERADRPALLDQSAQTTPKVNAVASLPHAANAKKRRDAVAKSMLDEKELTLANKARHGKSSQLAEHPVSLRDDGERNSDALHAGGQGEQRDPAMDEDMSGHDAKEKETRKLNLFTDQDKEDALNDLQDHLPYPDASSEAQDMSSYNSSGHCKTSPATATPRVRRQTRQLILDPVEWLAQAADAPLMDTEVLHSHTTVQDELATAAALAASASADSDHDVEVSASDAARTEADPVAQHGELDTCDAADIRTQSASTKLSSALRGDQPELPDLPSRESEEREAALLADLLRDVPRQRRSQKTNKQKQRQQQQQETVEAEEQGKEPAADADLAKSVTASAPGTPLNEVKPNEVAPSKAAAAAAAVVDPDALVYNVFTRRVAKTSSPSIRVLSLLGITVHPETRALTVSDAEAVQSLAEELRAKRVSWPKLWSRGALYRQLEVLLSDDSVVDPAGRVADLLRLQYNKSHVRRQQPGVVVGDGTLMEGVVPATETSADKSAPLINSSASSAMETATAAAAAAAAVKAAPVPMAESIDDKLLTLQDLNPEQQAVIDLVMKGHHTYIGGGAGTGKSVLLRVMRQQLVREGLAVAVTGTTGIAGTQIGGCTLHHCLGINVSGEFTRRKELSSYDVLIIDEVSMLSRELFESLEVHLRRANNIHLPFGGVQIILCGDFLQLGAIDARPLITSPLFRRHFVHLKLRTVVRQNTNLRFAAQLQQLRRGQVPADLVDTVRFVSPQQIEAEHAAETELKQRQQTQLAALAARTSGSGDMRENTDAVRKTEASISSDDGEESVHTRDELDDADQHGPADSPNTSANDAAGDGAMPRTPFVHGAVNLLPTNREVHATNAQQLQQLPGELVHYAPQFLPPSLVGSWSPTYILRIYDPAKAQLKTVRQFIERYLRSFYTEDHRAPPLPSLRHAATITTAAPSPEQHDVLLSLPTSSTSGGFSDGEWLLQPRQGGRHVVLYALFVDAFALRVRLPLTMDREEARLFLLHLADLDRHLAKGDLGVRIRDVLPHGDGMHTEQDEYILSQYAARAPLAHALDLKVGARVMLRTNFAPGLVNGSLGTVVGFKKLVVEELPRYLVGTAQREESIAQYSDFLQYEQGFQVPMVPVVDFNGRQVPIPPMTQYVGGLPNTHFYSMGVVGLPLSLAYAFTVHKVQGLTLVGRVHLELSRMWPCEHLLYVAMSRVRNPEQLSVSSFHPKLVRAAADCLLFDDSLPTVWEAVIQPYMLAATWRRAPSRRKKVLLKKKLEAYAKQRKSRLQDEARKGDIRAEIRLLEEKMLKQRARAVAKARQQKS